MSRWTSSNGTCVGCPSLHRLAPIHKHLASGFHGRVKRGKRVGSVLCFAGRSPTLQRALRDYDVLVSLDPLPILQKDRFNPTASGERILMLPSSELGSYARRANFGEPTVYLGAVGAGTSIVDHLDTNLGAHAVVHEFGHVLGLPHSHQNPTGDPIGPSVKSKSFSSAL